MSKQHDNLGNSGVVQYDDVEMQDDFNEDFEDLSDADTDDDLYEDEPAGAEVVNRIPDTMGDKAKKYRLELREEVLALGGLARCLPQLLRQLHASPLRDQIMASFGSYDQLMKALDKLLISQDTYIKCMQSEVNTWSAKWLEFAHDSLEGKVAPYRITELIDAIQATSFDKIRDAQADTKIAGLTALIDQLQVNNAKLEYRNRILKTTETRRRAKLIKMNIRMNDQRTQIAKQENMFNQVQAGATQINHIHVHPQDQAQALPTIGRGQSFLPANKVQPHIGYQDHHDDKRNRVQSQSKLKFKYFKPAKLPKALEMPKMPRFSTECKFRDDCRNVNKNKCRLVHPYQRAFYKDNNFNLLPEWVEANEVGLPPDGGCKCEKHTPRPVT